jgi:hypothetical protein
MSPPSGFDMVALYNIIYNNVTPSRFQDKLLRLALQIRKAARYKERAALMSRVFFTTLRPAQDLRMCHRA